jgi:hypothetical protein
VGVALSGLILVLGYVGLAPALSWVPEVPLLVVAIVLPVAALAFAGRLGSRRGESWVAGALAGAIAGAIAGVVGGVAYVAWGKPTLNIVVGLALGLIGGTVVGACGAWPGRRRAKGS